MSTREFNVCKNCRSAEYCIFHRWSQPVPIWHENTVDGNWEVYVALQRRCNVLVTVSRKEGARAHQYYINPNYAGCPKCDISTSWQQTSLPPETNIALSKQTAWARQRSPICWVTLTCKLVLEMGPGDLPAVKVWTSIKGQLGSGPNQQPKPLPLGGPNQDPYLSTHGFCPIWVDPVVPISGSTCPVSLLIITFRYVTVNHKILA